MNVDLIRYYFVQAGADTFPIGFHSRFGDQPPTRVLVLSHHHTRVSYSVPTELLCPLSTERGSNIPSSSEDEMREREREREKDSFSTCVFQAMLIHDFVRIIVAEEDEIICFSIFFSQFVTSCPGKCTKKPDILDAIYSSHCMTSYTGL